LVLLQVSTEISFLNPSRDLSQDFNFDKKLRRQSTNCTLDRITRHEDIYTS
jgi:hypothetical protein